MSNATYHPAEALRPGDIWYDDGNWRVLDQTGGRTYRLLNETTGEVRSAAFPNILLPMDPPSPPVAQLIDSSRTARDYCTPDAGLYALKAAEWLAMGPEDTHAIIVEVQRWVDESDLPWDHPDACGWLGGNVAFATLVGAFEALLHDLKSQLFTFNLDHTGRPKRHAFDLDELVPHQICVLRPWFAIPSPSE